MEDIEKIKKIAKLSLELKRHGFAVSSDEAVKQSEAIFQERILSPRGISEISSQQSQGGFPMDQFEQFKKQTNDQLKELHDTLGSIVSKMNEIIKSINDLEQAQKVAKPVVVQRSEPQRFSSEPAKDDGSRTITPRPEKGSESNQRSGNFTPQDVQIDKIFYYGNKK